MRKTTQEKIESARASLELANLRAEKRKVQARSKLLSGYLSTASGDFEAARRDRFNQGSFSYSGIGQNELTPDDAIIPDLQELRKRSNSAVNNDPIAKGIIRKVVSGVIGTGLSMRPAFARATLTRLLGMTPEGIDFAQGVLAEHFAPWADSTACDYGDRQNLYQRTAQVCHVEAASGESFVQFVRSNNRNEYGLKLKHIHPMLCMSPPEKLQDPYCVNGVEIDKASEAPVAYWFIKDPTRPYDKDNFERIPAKDEKTGRRNVLHIYNQFQPGQTRGIPRLASDLRMLGNMKRVNDANVMAELVRSYFTAFITTQTPGQWQPADTQSDPIIAGTGGTRDSTTETPGRQVRMGAGAVQFLNPNESAQIATPQSNSTYEAWVTAHMKFLGMSQEIPYEVLMDAFQSSYSASRAARLTWRKNCEVKRWQIVYQFLQPVAQEFIWVESALGRLDLPGYFVDSRIRNAYESIAWDGDAIGLLDPLQEAKAADQLIATGISNLAEQTTAVTGGDWRAVANQRAEEKRLYKSLGLQPELFDKSGQPLPGATNDPAQS